MNTIINFIALLILFYFLLKKPIVQAFKKRHLDYAQALDEARTLLSKNTAQYEEWTAHLKSVDTEIEFIKKSSEKEAEQLSQRIQQNVQSLSMDLVSDAKVKALNLVKNFAKEMTVEMTDKILLESEKIISKKITNDDQKKFQNDFSQQVTGGVA